MSEPNVIDAEREVRLPPWYVRYAEFDGVAVVLRDEDRGDQQHAPAPARFGITWGRLPLVDCPMCGATHKVRVGAYIWEGDDPEEAERQFHLAEERLLRGEFQR